MMAPTISVEIDTEINAAYVHLSDEAVARTVEYSEEINVDLDRHDVVVGIEILDLATPVPLDELAAKHHIHTATLARLLAAIQPTTTEVSGSQTSPVEYQTIAPSELVGPSS